MRSLIGQAHVNDPRHSGLEPGHKWCPGKPNQNFPRCVTQPAWVQQGVGFFVHNTTVVEFSCVLLDNCVIPLFSSLNKIVQGGKHHKQIFDVLITSSLLACAASFQHSQFKGFSSVGLKM